MMSAYAILALFAACAAVARAADDLGMAPKPRATVVSIDGDRLRINGRYTFPGRVWNGIRIEGLLMNSRMVQATFDDENPETTRLWKYPDGPWDADRNVNECIAAMPEWKRHGLLAITVNFQGGSPQGYSQQQPWINSAFTWDGDLKPECAARMARIIDAADNLGMVVILGFFYFGQEPKMNGEPAILRACDAATDWVLRQGYTNVIIEVANECNVVYKDTIITPGRGNELIQRIQQRSAGSREKGSAGKKGQSTLRNNIVSTRHVAETWPASE